MIRHRSLHKQPQQKQQRAYFICFFLNRLQCVRIQVGHNHYTMLNDIILLQFALDFQIFYAIF